MGKRIILLIFFAGYFISGFAGNYRQSLAGLWGIKLDPNDIGLQEKWFNKTFSESLQLPGSCEQRGFGVKTSNPAIGRLTRTVRYIGKAWYRKEVDIPQEWFGKRIELFLERCHWETNVWIDGQPVGMRNSLSVPHLYDFGILTPGKHMITICVDNTYKIPIGTWNHGITEDTQGNWNGIIGRIELRATDPVWIRNVQVYRDHLRVKVGNATGKGIKATIQKTPFFIPSEGGEFKIPFDIAGQEWNEFNPVMQQVEVFLKVGKYSDSKRVTYANSKLGIKDKQFTNNGVPFLLRGPVDECVYPLTGYPPMDKSDWLRILSICKAHGFNYLRFHSWCPPEAAFQAGDELGFYFQVELPLWTMDAPHFGKHAERDQYITEELLHILETYGNHPSFALMGMGNESAGELDRLVSLARNVDNRRLYRCENGDTYQNGDFFETGQRGIAGPRTDWDRWNSSRGWLAGIGGSGVDKSTTGSEVPTLSHEIGQWAMYPDFSEIKKYTGTLRAYNYEEYKKSLITGGMFDQADDFFEASGKFSVLLYKEEIEANLRTFPHGGFQLLEARDYPGQGTAIVGWLDAFWDSKGLITPQEFRHFCDSKVALLRMPKRIYTNQEDFVAYSELSDYTNESDTRVEPAWSIVDDAGHSIAKGSLPVINIKSGGVSSLGKIVASLKGIDKATRLKVSVIVGDVSNSWHIWVYPAEQPAPPDNVRVVYAYDEATKEALRRGKNVVLFSDPNKGIYPTNPKMLQPDSVRLFKIKKGQSALKGTFLPAFWNLRLFNQPGTLGLLCDASHPALAQFPTEKYSDWQWADLIGRYTAADSFRAANAPESYCQELENVWGDVNGRSKAIVLNGSPKGFRPIVQPIDNYERNYKLGVIFETRVGIGKLLVCAMDLDTNAENRPAARQLKTSLLQYAAGDSFIPEYELSAELLETILTYDD
ncbi:sugar-binding domain-containing protein [Parabacteroides sp. Marseille-P3160]|uniref:sugar-binding domain-containing protein n=1 Tax=Parabacteroides sp. Marseille-P3160 TaxID=1917887 RepID=UPI0009B9E24B|nr:sugar-binding domain-containing protein [Parabacteroides sp. Marseille-P3160]